MKPLVWLLHRKIELAIFLFGVLLRLSMSWNYHATWSYDSYLHWEVIQWIADHGKVPGAEATFESFHPPLYYAVGAWFLNHGVTRDGMVWVSIVCGVLRLGVIWAGLELYVVGSRLARVMALALAAAVAASVHIDGMVYPEALNGLLCAVAMVLVPLAFRRSTMARWPLAFAIGMVLGLAILTKISAVSVLGAVGVSVFLEFLISRKTLRIRLCNALPWAFTAVTCLAVCGWYYANNVRVYGQPFVTSFDLNSQYGMVADADKQRFLDRRTLGYLFDWDTSIYRFPYAIEGLGNHPRFFPVTVASTFVDFWCYRFQGYDMPWQPWHPGRSPRTRQDPTVMTFARCAVAGGTVIFAATVAAWFASLRRVVRHRDLGRLALLLVVLFAVAASAQYTIKYPIDGLGVIKGIYITFAGPPMYALFGIAASWAQRKRSLWPIFGSLAVALWLVVSYTVYCRLGLRILPVS